MFFSKSVWLFFVVATLLMVFPIAAQEAIVATGDGVRPHELRGQDLPQYYVVETLFEELGRYFLSGERYGFTTEEKHEQFITSLGLDLLPKPTRDSILMRATIEADASLSQSLFNRDLAHDRVAFEAFQRKARRARALAVGEAYGRLLSELESSALSAKTFQEKLDARIRPRVFIGGGSGPVDSSILNIDQHFNAGTARSLTIPERDN